MSKTATILIIIAVNLLWLVMWFYGLAAGNFLVWLTSYGMMLVGGSVTFWLGERVDL